MTNSGVICHIYCSALSVIALSVELVPASHPEFDLRVSLQHSWGR